MSESTSTSIDKVIRTRLVSLQSSFFKSLQSGTDALATFDHQLTGFYEAVNRSEQHLEGETRLLIYSFVEMSNAVIPALIDLDIASERINQEQSEEFNKLLSELSLDDASYPEPDIHPPYIQAAYTWLLANLHNPYPSKQSRLSFSKQTGTPQKDIDSWFTDVRKRIGWNSLRKKYFSTRKDMITAATRFFKPLSMQLDSRTEPEDAAYFDQEFALLEDSAKNLYSRKFSASALASGLEGVKVVTAETNPAGQGISLAPQILSQEIEPIPTPPYSSPEFISPSPLNFSSPSPSPSSSRPSSQDRKRRQCTSDPNSSSETRPLKRMRTSDSLDIRVDPPVPSTQTTTEQPSPSSLASSPSPNTTNSVSISEASRKRKRQSSDSDSHQGRTKRAHCIPSSPLNSLIKPLPSGSSNLLDLDHWFKSLCGESIDLGHSIPEPVYETCPLTAAVEIDFYRYASSSPSSSVSSLGPSTPPDYNSSDSPAASHESLTWLESPSLTKLQGHDSLAEVRSEFLPMTWSEEGFLFDLTSPGILDADFPSQNWDLGLTPAMSTNNYSISNVLQEVVHEPAQPWTNEPVPISAPKPSNQLSLLTSFSDNRDKTPLPQVFEYPFLDKKGAKIRYLQTLLNEVQNVRYDLAL